MLSLLLMLTVASLGLSLPVEGRADTPKCLNALNGSLVRLSGLQSREIRRCLRAAARSQLETPLLECLVGDAKGRRAKARAKLASGAARHCSDPLPDFGRPRSSIATNLATIEQAAVQKELGLLGDVFGSDLEAVLATPTKCQRSVWKAVSRCQDLHLKAFNACKKRGIKKGEINDGSGIAGCVGTDPKGRLARVCAKIAVAIDRRCDAPEWPGCAGPDPAACMESPVRCRVCPTLNTVDDLDIDCDLFDNAAADGSCLTGDILALAYNVAGLPEGISGSHPAMFMPLIGPPLNLYPWISFAGGSPCLISN